MKRLTNVSHTFLATYDAATCKFSPQVEFAVVFTEQYFQQVGEEILKKDDLTRVCFVAPPLLLRELSVRLLELANSAEEALKKSMYPTGKD
jgi:hypothetical protein